MLDFSYLEEKCIEQRQMQTESHRHKVWVYKHTFEESQESWLSPNVENAAESNLRRLVSKWEFSLSWKIYVWVKIWNCLALLSPIHLNCTDGVYFWHKCVFWCPTWTESRLKEVNNACTLFNPFPLRLVTWSVWNVSPLGQEYQWSGCFFSHNLWFIYKGKNHELIVDRWEENQNLCILKWDLMPKFCVKSICIDTFTNTIFTF